MALSFATTLGGGEDSGPIPVTHKFPSQMDPQTLTQPNPAAALAQPALAQPAAAAPATAAPPAGAHIRSANRPGCALLPFGGDFHLPLVTPCVCRAAEAQPEAESAETPVAEPQEPASGAPALPLAPALAPRWLRRIIRSGHRAAAESARGRGVAQTRTCSVYPCRASCSINRIRCPPVNLPRPHSHEPSPPPELTDSLLRLRFSGGSADRGAREPVRLQNPRLAFPRRPSKGCASAPPVLPRPAPARTHDRGSCGSRLAHSLARLCFCRGSE